MRTTTTPLRRTEQSLSAKGEDEPESDKARMKEKENV
jgi:hypothetical protein